MTQEELQAIQVEQIENSSVKITGEVPFSYLEKHRSAAVKYLGQDIQIDGFRKGNIPEKVLIERIGEMTLLTEMAERAIREIYPQVIDHHKLEVIGYPQIGITKIAAGNPLGFSATVAVIPAIKLPDYIAIAREVNKERVSDEVTDEELTKQIEDILRQKIAYERLQAKAARKAGQEKRGLGNATELPTPESVNEKVADEEAFDDPSKIELPELTDEYVKTLGQPGQFESVADFKSKLREHLEIEKKREVASAHRAKITDQIIEKSEFELPQVLIEAELGQMSAQMEEDLTRAQLTIEDYLSHIKKTKEDLKKEWTPSAQKRARLQLVLNEIAKKENIKPDTGAVDHEVSHVLEHYKEADERRVRTYIETLLQNEAVLKMLEEQK